MTADTSTSKSWFDGRKLPIAIFNLIVIWIAIWIAFKKHDAPVPPVNQSVAAQPAPQVQSVTKVPVAVKAPVKIYKGGAVLKDGLKLPAAVVADSNKAVIASSQVRADDHPQTITTVINTETGESETFVKRDPLPWLAFDNKGEASIATILKSSGLAVRAQAREEFAQIKAVHVGGIIGADIPIAGIPGSADVYGGIQAWVNW